MSKWLLIKIFGIVDILYHLPLYVIMSDKAEFKILMIRRLRAIVMHRNNACNNYCDIDIFLAHINSAIQELRNLTFLLQKHKKLYSDFDSRYATKQEGMKNDENLGWIVDSRNKIVKQEDLRINSIAYSSLVNRLELKLPPIPIDPFWSDEDIISFFLNLFDTSKIKFLCESMGMPVLQIKKVWIDKDYKDRDVLLLIKYWFDHLSRLIFEFLDLISIEYEFNDKMLVDKLNENQLYFLDISDNSVFSRKQHTIPFDAGIAESILKDMIWIDKIKSIKSNDWPPTIDGLMEHFLTVAKLIVENWMEHKPTYFYLSEDNGILWQWQAVIPDRASKYVRIRSLANEIKNNSKIFAILLIDEVRIVAQENRTEHMKDPSLKTAKEEALSLTFYNQKWEIRSWTLPIYRKAWSVSFWKLQTDKKWIHNILNPISEVWGIDINKNTDS